MAWKKFKGKYNISSKKDRTWKGIVFDSKHEMLYAQQLELRKKAGDIANYQMQVPYLLEVNGMKIAKYILDFLVEYPDGRLEYIDTKSRKSLVTSEFKLKQKLMKAIYGIDVVCVYQA